MQKSRRARRMERHHKLKKSPGINLVSLMDIFTILVFFLLVNSSNPQELSSSEDLKLPSSLSQVLPEETLVISITKNNILVQGTNVIGLDQALQQEGDILEALKEELGFQAAGSNATVGAQGQEEGRPITIMGHENISYELIRKILMTCQQSNFTRIAFATNQRVNSLDSVLE